MVTEIRFSLLAFERCIVPKPVIIQFNAQAWLRRDLDMAVLVQPEWLGVSFFGLYWSKVFHPKWASGFHPNWSTGFHPKWSMRMLAKLL